MIERGVMMELKMFSKPVVFTDFDGVLNAFPDDKLLRRSGVNKVMTWAKPDSPYAKIYNPEKAFHLDGNEKAHTPVGSWRIHWSSELSDAMYALAVDGIVELWWLSTWQPYCSQILDPMLGWDPMLVDVITWYDPVTKWGRETGNGRPSNDAYASNAKRMNPRRSYGSTMMNASNSARSSWRNSSRKRRCLWSVRTIVSASAVANGN